MGCMSSKGTDADAGAVRKDEPAKATTESAPAPQPASQPAAPEPAADPKKFVVSIFFHSFLFCTEMCVFHMMGGGS